MPMLASAATPNSASQQSAFSVRLASDVLALGPRASHLLQPRPRASPQSHVSTDSDRQPDNA